MNIINLSMVSGRNPAYFFLLNSAWNSSGLAVITKQVSGNTFTITVSDGNNLREPVLVLIGAQAHRQEGAAIFTPCGTSFSSLGGTISMSKSENIWTVIGSDSGYGMALIIGSKRMISMLA